MLIYEKKQLFPWKGLYWANFFNLNCILKVGNCPSVISKMKNSFHSKWLLISQFKLMRFFFFLHGWIQNTSKLSKRSSADCPHWAFFSHFICKNAYRHLHLHLRKKVETLKTFARQSNQKLLSPNGNFTTSLLHDCDVLSCLLGIFQGTVSFLVRGTWLCTYLQAENPHQVSQSMC